MPRFLHHLLLALLFLIPLPASLAAETATSEARPASIRVVLDDNYPPYIFRSRDGQVRGILKDLWDIWQARTGIRVDFQPMDWSKALAAMERKEADVIDTLFRTEARMPYFEFSEPYATIEVPIFFHHSIAGITDATSLKGFTVGVKQGDACIEYLHNNGIQDLRPYLSYEAEAAAAAREEIRVLCMDRPPAIYYFNREKVADRFRESPPLYLGQFHWAVAKGRTDLQKVVQQGFALISPEERAAIEERWQGRTLPGSNWSPLSRNVTQAILAMLAIVFVLGTWTWTLRRRVTTRTAELSATLASLRNTEAQFRNLFEQANDAIFVMSGSNVVDCNRRAEMLYGLPREQIIGTNPISVSPTLQPDGRPSDEVIREVIAMANEGHPVVFEWQHQMPDGRVLDVEVSLSRVEFAGQRCLQSIVRDITERKRSEAEIQRLANYDTLTGLPNRRLLQERLHQALSAAGRRHTLGAVLFLDLDNFKTLNDTRGHDFGDRLLEEVGRRLRHCVRADDSVARLGGDEFVILLEGLVYPIRDAAGQAETVAEKVLEAIRQPFQLGNVEHHITTSLGVCLFSGARDETVDEMLKRADAAMYRAKSDGRNAIRFFDPAMQTSLEARARLEAELRRALPMQQFQLFYQAQVDGERRMVGAEVLLRWQHPREGLLPPAKFISLAETSGLIVPIGHWVLETACRQLKAWHCQPGLEHLRIAVNVSARQFRQDNFVETVGAIIAESGAPANRLTLELTESLVLENMADSIEKMNDLKAMGISLSMDDFGTGYSSLSYLKRLPLNELKIDQSFVRDITSDPGDAVIVRTIIAMATNLGLTVVAEGVERQEELDFLISHECKRFQGYLFARPLPQDQFEQTLPCHT